MVVGVSVVATGRRIDLAALVHGLRVFSRRVAVQRDLKTNNMNHGRNKLQIREKLGQRSRDFLEVASGWSKLLEIEDRIFAERRLWFYGSNLVVTYGIAMVLAWGLNQGEWVIRPDGSLPNIDFCWIWVSGKFAASSDPARVYDYAVFSAAQASLVGPPTGNALPYHFLYPPILLFFVYPLGLISYLTAYSVWIFVTLLLYLAAAYTIIPRSAVYIGALAPAVVVKNIQLGHNGFLTAAIIGLSLGLMERRPWLAGLILGCLTYKPQFGILFPLALLASRNWRTLCSATVTSVLLGVAAAVAFGYQGWLSFIGSLLARNSSLSPDGEMELSLQSLYGLLHWAGASDWISWSVHLTSAAIVAAMVCAIWAKPISYYLKAAVLCIASVAVSPYVLAYDLCILSIAGAFLIRDGMSRGFLPGERMGMLICFAGLFPVATPIAPIVCVGLLVLCARRIVTYRCGLLTT